MNENATSQQRAADEIEIKRLQGVAQRVNKRVTGSFVVHRKAEGEWGHGSDGCRLGREERFDVRCHIKGLEGEFESNDMLMYNRKVFPHPFMRFVPWPEGPHGALPDHIVVASTTAARNGKFFDVLDVCAAIEESMNLWHEGRPRALFDVGLDRLASIESFTDPGTIWDLTPPEHDPVPTMPRMVDCREKVFVFAMGLHPRLGAQAGMNVLDPESLRRIGEIVLSAEAEVTRASIPIFCTTWRERVYDDDGREEESEEEEEVGGLEQGSEEEEEWSDGEEVSEDGYEN
ncbi:hypothetical protein T484DRAFT_1837567 [Baffinella frigidus]|nr:hypothetical protein T484DRAFT_1837567 [Cryptophyta sp. CCMP2293]